MKEKTKKKQNKNADRIRAVKQNPNTCPKCERENALVYRPVLLHRELPWLFTRVFCIDPICAYFVGE